MFQLVYDLIFVRLFPTSPQHPGTKGQRSTEKRPLGTAGVGELHHVDSWLVVGDSFWRFEG